MESESREFDTPFGKMVLFVYPGKVFFRTLDDAYLTVNRVEYRVCGGLVLRGAEWVQNPESPLSLSRNSTEYMSRSQEYTRSQNARKKFRDQVYPLMAEWLASEVGAEAMHEATIADYEDKIARKDREINEATHLISRLNGERRELQEQRDKLVKP